MANTFNEKGKEFYEIVKSGRTHLMDAMPVTLGEELKAYAVAIERAAERIRQRRDELLELPIGGTATGTGANTHPKYRETIITELSELCEVKFSGARDCFEAIQSRAQLAAFSGSLKELALELIRIANDLRLLNSGHTSGLAEISLPAVQPGSSIMPGKVNPVMAECLNMIAFQVIGNDTSVSLAAQAGQLELNVMTPLIAYDILTSIELLTNFLPVFRSRCVEGIKANEERCRSLMVANPALATLLSPRIGYLRAAELAKEAMSREVPVVELALEKGIITVKEAEDIFEGTEISHCKYESDSGRGAGEDD
jgi:aspartate ammonia-lyase